MSSIDFTSFLKLMAHKKASDLFVTVGIGMLFRRQHFGDHERLERALVVNGFHFQPDHRQLFDDLIERGVCFQMVFQPGKGEFHRSGLSSVC